MKNKIIISALTAALALSSLFGTLSAFAEELPDDGIADEEALEASDSADWLLEEDDSAQDGEDTASADDDPNSPGGHIFEGYIYYIKEDGTRASGESLGILDFTNVGYYTTGDLELDDLLAVFFRDAGAEKYEFGSIEQLQALFKWEVNHFRYLKSEMIEGGTHGWENDAAKLMLEKGKGNCYSFAALFYQASKAIGYEPIAYSGRINVSKPHGWVEITIDGTLYIFDPEICYNQYYLNADYTQSFFMKTYDYLRGWNYRKLGDDLPKEEE